MNHFYRVGLASILLASTTVHCASPVEGWYAGLMGGVSYTNTVNFDFINPFLSAPLGTNTGSITYKLGGNGGGQVGYRFCDNFRFEVELNGNWTPIEKISIGQLTLHTHQNPRGFNIGGSTGYGAAFFNAYYDFFYEGSPTSWVPYVGLGIGYARLQSKISLSSSIFNITPFLSSNNLNSLSETTSAPMGQAIAGISYFITDNTSVGLDFRYLTTNSLNLSNRDIHLRNTKVSVETLNINFNYAFDAPLYN